VARRSAAVLLVAIATGACIVPDANLRVQGDATNPGSVRLLQSITLTDEANDACRSDPSTELSSCPLVPETLPFGAIDPELPLCVCSGRDGNALSYFDIYVEDPDLDDGRPKDSIFGVLLLDMPAATVDPAEFVAYTNLFPPTVPAANVNLGFNSYSNAIERPEPLVRRWTLGADTGVDLCNDNPAGKLDPGLHSLRLVVTDRPWYREVELEEDGQAMVDDDGELVRVPVEMASIGVPDLPGGATYAIADYVFRCDDGDDPESSCNCVDQVEG
jgi:hypothetical protein